MAKRIIATISVFLFIFPNMRVCAVKGISAKSYVVIEAVSGRIILSKNENMKLPMASTTKIMTSLIALESDKLDENFVVDSKSIKAEGTSMGLLAGDIVSLRTLVCGMLLSSGNDAANAVAVRISGSIHSFVDVMNNKAVELGLKNTCFETPSGLDGESHYSTAYDMAKLASVAINNSDFVDICSKSTMKVRFGSPPCERILYNHNKLLGLYEGAIGVKTGYTKKAGRCLVSAVKRDGVTLICVTLNASDDWNDHIKLYDTSFKKITPHQTDDVVFDIDVVGGESDSASAVSNGININLVDGYANNVTKRILCDKFLYAPVSAGQVVGRVEYYVDNILVCTKTISTSDNVNYKQISKRKETSWFERLFGFLFQFLGF